VGDANEAPLVLNFIKTAQQKLTKAPGLFDLAEDGLGQLVLSR
jgi:hypothetical protein